MTAVRGGAGRTWARVRGALAIGLLAACEAERRDEPADAGVVADGAGAAGGAVAPGAGAVRMDAAAPLADAAVTAVTDAAPAPGPAGDGSTPAGRSICPAGPFPEPMPGPSQRVCAGFAFAASHNEGPTWVASQGAFYFTNFVAGAPTGGDIIKYTPGGSCEFFQRQIGCNGLAATPDGDLVAACQQSRSVIRFDLKTGATRTLATTFEGQMLDTPNDLVVHSNGTIYFTNPPFELGNRPRGVGPGVFRIDPAGTLTRVYQGGPPNGIALSPDQQRLYALNGGIWDLDGAGVPSNRRELFTRGDGMAVDCAGNIYAQGRIFTAEGRVIGDYGGGTNLAFGGSDGRLLFIAGTGSVRVVEMNLPGLP